MKKSKKLSIIGLIIGALLLIFELIIYFLSGKEVTNDFFIYPQIATFILAIGFNFNGVFLTNYKMIKYASIIYLISFFALPSWGFICIPSAILLFKAMKEYEDEQDIKNKN